MSSINMSKEDKEILKDMKDAGEITEEEYKKEIGEDAGDDKKVEPKNINNEPPKPDKPEVDEGKPGDEPKPEEKPEDKKDKKDEKPEKDKKEDKEPKEDEEISRTPMVTLSKYQKLKKKYRDLKTKKAEAVTPKEKEEVDKELKEFAEKNKLDPEALSGLVSIISKRVTPPAPTKTDDQIKADKKQQKEARIKAEETGFENEFENKVIPLLTEKYPKVTLAQTKKIKEKLRVLAYTKELATTPLGIIFRAHRSDFKDILKPTKKKSAESSRGGSSKGKKSFPLDRELTEEEIDSMSDKEFDEYCEKKEKQSSKFTVRDKSGNIVK